MKTLRSLITLTRLDRPIGIFLLLWPTWWALLIASNGHPSLKNITIFTVGVILMRSAGCVVNDLADAQFDKHVKRTQHRPLAQNYLSRQTAFITFLVLSATAFSLVLLTNAFTIQLSFLALALACIYPFAKRFIALPQVVLGAAFAFAVPMVFSASQNQLPFLCFPLYLAATLWPLAYDTFYAMADKTDDLKIGIHSSPILFGPHLKPITAFIYILFFLLILGIAIYLQLKPAFYVAYVLAILSVCFQFWHIRDNIPEHYFQAFRQNNLTGFLLFCGLLMGYY